jgi:hypothetical protein
LDACWLAAFTLIGQIIHDIRLSQTSASSLATSSIILSISRTRPLFIDV